jgi:hypothetical protein
LKKFYFVGAFSIPANCNTFAQKVGQKIESATISGMVAKKFEVKVSRNKKILKKTQNNNSNKKNCADTRHLIK